MTVNLLFRCISSDCFAPAFSVLADQAKDAKSPGEVFKDCADCPEMVVIPSGSFQMGPAKVDGDEAPVHAIIIKRMFAAARLKADATLCAPPIAAVAIQIPAAMI